MSDVLRLESLLEPPLLSKAAVHARIVGCNSALPLALWMAQKSPLLHQAPQLVVFASDDAAKKFEQQLLELGLQNIYLLPSFDVDVFSGLYPSSQMMGRRLAWLHAAQGAGGGTVFIASAEALAQKTLPFDVLNKNTHVLNREDALPENFPRLLQAIGYTPVPIVEDPGTFSWRGGIIDVFSPAHKNPVRLELFGDLIESMREYDRVTQRSVTDCNQLEIIPTLETLCPEDDRQEVILRWRASLEKRNVSTKTAQPIIHQLSQGSFFHGQEFLLPFYYKQLAQPAEHFSQPVNVWLIDPLEITHQLDEFLANFKQGLQEVNDALLIPNHEIYASGGGGDLPILFPPDSKLFEWVKIDFDSAGSTQVSHSIEYHTYPIDEFEVQCQNLRKNMAQLRTYISQKFSEWLEHGFKITVSAPSDYHVKKLQLLFADAQISFEQIEKLSDLIQKDAGVYIVPQNIFENLRVIEDKLLLINDAVILGSRAKRKSYKDSGSLQKRAHALSFADLKTGDLIVHRAHGVGIYRGLKVMPIHGYDTEFLYLEYKDGDKLYLPIYRVGQLQKYAGPESARLIDKLGGIGWEKTKTRVKKQLRDLAADLLKLYADRAQLTRPSFGEPDDDFLSFESQFPYDETPDQLKAIEDILKDLHQEKPMDRLICGDVGFGKTEVAMRATFKVVQDGFQVAIIAPTTVLTFQHLENFKKRFKNFPCTIRSLNRFVPAGEQKETVEMLQDGKVNIIIGTHRLLSKDIAFKNLGLLVIDEEQKFGVKHKERLRQLKASVDTLTMSATPIPRTLNLSLVGLRDLSLINTPPVDRLPTRTFICRFEKATVKRAIESELKRGGQVFFLHNRVQSIESIANDLREILPGAKMTIAHGQMEEGKLEKAMLQFVNREVDILICTTIIESGMDIPNANTMFIDNAHELGLSQLYQLRGRVGRSKERAYCYLLVPPNRKLDSDQQERLRVIQENTALGSGIQIAQHDLELRGSGDILGIDQSGHINAVGYELYMELLDETIRQQRGEKPVDNELEPEINVRIQSLIPDAYIPDIRIRLSYYKALADIESEDDIARIEEELRDQFGKPPEPVLNLLGLMLIRHVCKNLGIKDISSGKESISLSFVEQTPLPSEKVVQLSTRENKKYSITPDNRLIIRMKKLEWPRIYDELAYLISLC